jgi:ribonuclease P protein component
VERRHRLSRSRDFDAVYRHGRSVSTRFLLLYWFPRELDGEPAPRLGLAVPRKLAGAVKRNRLKRQLREIWRSLLDELPVENDYVLVARSGLVEATDTRGFEWLRERVEEVLQKGGLVQGARA